MRALVSADEMRRAEMDAVEHSLSLPALMQLAAHGAAQFLLRTRRRGAERFLVLAGPGNNGGDALVVAGLLRDAGATVQIATYRRSRPSAVDPDGIDRFDSANDADGLLLSAALRSCDVIVDGILGIGKARPVDDDLAALLRVLNDASPEVRRIALDVPTGVDADSGRADAAAFRADHTLTFGYEKRGLLLYPARALVGTIQIIDIGLPSVPRIPVAAWAAEVQDVAAWLPRRTATAQKFSAGAVLALAGSPHYAGAPILCTSAAFRAGAGYVTLAAQQSTLDVLATRMLETTMYALPADAVLATRELQDIAARYGALIIGPGLGRADSTQELVMRVLSSTFKGPKAAVVDADALFALSQTANWWTRLSLPLVLTPHSGEMARLTGLETRAIDVDRLAIAQRFARQWQQVIVLKGAPTVIASPDGELAVNQTGNPLLATAGTGDVLSGVIAALIAGGAQPFDAARAGVYLHGLAADLALPTYGDRGMVAGDLPALLPEAIKRVLAHDRQ